MSNWIEDTPFDREELFDYKEEESSEKLVNCYILMKIIKLCIRQVEKSLRYV